jgi:hypothetical protein
MRFDDTMQARLRRGIMARGQTLATLLADVLAGKDKQRELAAVGLSDRPGVKPEEALRGALDQVESRRALLDADDDRFGRCDVCAAPIALAALVELPWADRCQAHAAV